MEQHQRTEQSGSQAKPAFTSTDLPVPTSPRERTRRHMRRLLGKATKLGLAATACSCLACPDPLPSPMAIDCSQDLTAQYLGEFIASAAEWVDVDAVGPAVSLDVYISVTGLDFDGEPTAQSATMAYVARQPGLMTIVLVPAEGATSIRVSVPVTCGERTAAVDLVADVSGPRDAGTYVPVAPASE